jgi:nitroreductase
MDFKDLVEHRRSVHRFASGFKVTKRQWKEILEYVRYTPSGYNAQPWKFKLIQAETELQKMHKLCYSQKHILTSGNLVVVIGDVEFGNHEAERIVKEWREHRHFTEKQAEALHASLVKDREAWKKREMVIRNCSLAAMTFMYAAEDLGLAACPMMGFRQLDLKRELGLKEHELPIMLIALGKAEADELERLPRKTVDALEG